MAFLYDCVLFIYYTLIQFSSLFNSKANKWVKGRKNWVDLLSSTRKEKEKWIWFHCSSLGEYEDCCEVFYQIRRDNPSKKTLLTFHSPSGFEAKEKSNEFNLVMYIPQDTKRNSQQFIEILKPDVIFFSRSELWFNFIMEIKKSNIPIFLLSLKLNKKSNFLKQPAKIIYAKCFNAFTYIYCQNEITQRLLSDHFNISNTSITGNTRFDRIYRESLSLKEIPYIKQFSENNFIIVSGSCLLKDEKNIIAAFNHLKSSKIKCVIVPHEIDSERIDKIVKKNTDKIIRYSNIEFLKESHTILYIDSIGILKYLYRYANLAIIGGGFNKIGIHNIIEASIYGVKTTFGPNHKNYQEALDLINMDGAIVHNNIEELIKIIGKELTNPSDNILKEKIISYAQNNTGGSLKIIESIRAKGLI
jgi:3-deoxy-D-manno-octulosonic-acid transferase